MLKEQRGLGMLKGQEGEYAKGTEGVGYAKGTGR